MEHCRIIAVIIIIMGQFKEVKQEVGAVQGLSAAVLNIRPPPVRGCCRLSCCTLQRSETVCSERLAQNKRDWRGTG